MRISAFVGTFSHWPNVPVDLEDDVKPALLEVTKKDEIEIYSDPKLDAGVVRGMITHYAKTVDGETVNCAKITFAENQPLEWQRLVACKELLHVLDPVEVRVAEEHEIRHLIEKIVLPADMQDPVNDGQHALSDRLAATFAAAVLFPLAARDGLLPAFQAGRLTHNDIVELIGIPEPYVRLIMSSAWHQIHKILLSLR